jgi:predicted alpha/beta hydrolase family esterase
VGDAAGDPEPARIPARRRVVRRAGLSARPGLNRSFLILHGLEGSGPEHWQTWLAGRLRERGERVRYPGLPDPFDPDPDTWRACLREELAALQGERVVLCHSLACRLWLLHARDNDGMAAERVLLVAPPCADEIEAVARFRPDGVSAAAVRRAAAQTLIVCSDQDPYCSAGAVATYAEPLGVRYRLVPGAGHLNTDAGYGPWPWVEQWALDAAG